MPVNEAKPGLDIAALPHGLVHYGGFILFC